MLKLLLELQGRSISLGRERETGRAIFGLEKGSRGQGHTHTSPAARTRLLLAVLFVGIEISQG